MTLTLHARQSFSFFLSSAIYFQIKCFKNSMITSISMTKSLDPDCIKQLSAEKLADHKFYQVFISVTYFQTDNFILKESD